MGRMYAVTFESVNVSVAVDLFELIPADDKPLTVHALIIGQSSDAGDAQDEMLPIAIKRGHVTSGSGGASPTPAPLNPGDAAAGFTAETNNTTQASSGTAVTLYADTFNVRSGFVWIPTPESRPVANQGNSTLVVRLGAAPADQLTISGTLIVEEG